MRKAIGGLAVCGALALMLLLPGAASAGQPSGIKGVVLDTSCYGPCIVGAAQPPYAGSDLRIAIRRLPGGDLVRRLSPDGGRFSTRLRPGLYRVNAYVSAQCWTAEAKRVRVFAARFTRVTFHLQNSCILCPAVECLPCGPCPPPCEPCPPCLNGTICAYPCILETSHRDSAICPL